MIQTDITAAMIGSCNNCFIIISNGDTESIEEMMKLKNHELLVVRSVPSDLESMKIV